MKCYTDLPQSNKLAEFLPLESADCFYAANVIITEPFITYLNDERNIPGYKGAIPCWSLAALLDVLPKGKVLIDDVHSNKYKVIGYNLDTDYYDEPLDACYEMILKLHELKML